MTNNSLSFREKITALFDLFFTKGSNNFSVPSRCFNNFEIGNVVLINVILKNFVNYITIAIFLVYKRDDNRLVYLGIIIIQLLFRINKI